MLRWQLRLRQRGPGTSHRFAYLVVGLVILGVVGWFVGRPAYKRIKANRAEMLIKEAETLADKGKYAEAGKMLRTASGLAPTHPQVLRISSRLNARIGSANGLVTMQALMRSGSATWQDRLDYIKMALDFNRVDLSGAEIAGIFKTNRTDPAFLRLLVRHAVPA